MQYATWELWLAFAIGWFGWDIVKYAWSRATGKIDRKGDRL